LRKLIVVKWKKYPVSNQWPLSLLFLSHLFEFYNLEIGRGR
jgi:hypothetical protein